MAKPKKSFLFLQKKRKCERLLLKKTGFGNKKQVLGYRNGFSVIYKILLTYWKWGYMRNDHDRNA